MASSEDQDLDNVNTRDKYGCTALHFACRDGEIDLVTELLKCGADINSIAKNGWTALHFAIHYGHVNVVKTLIQNGANIHAITEVPVREVKENPESQSSTTAHTQTPPLSTQTPSLSTQTASLSTQTPSLSTRTTSLSTQTPSLSTQTTSLSTQTTSLSTQTPPLYMNEDTELVEKILILTENYKKNKKNPGKTNAKSDTLQHFHYQLIKHLRPFPLIDHLFSRGVIDDDQKDIISRRERYEGRAAGVEKLLKIMMRSERDDLGLFIECLEHEDVGYGELARELREYKPE